MANRLANETSPYLQQHAHNPVDWYPWGPEALERAKREDKPILLSIGYSACHWCHVMERESFEDPGTAEAMNARFVNVKVDREERPDLDDLYMAAVQAFTGGHGGWPMTVFLTPDGEPFVGGTYFPPTARYGMPSFHDVMNHAVRLYHQRPDHRDRVVTEIRALLGREPVASGATGELRDDWLDRVAEACVEDFDPDHGGFGSQPKFPPHGDLAALLAHWRRSGAKSSLDMATETLDAMARGGMYDLIGGGFARYSVDDRWLIPHFEKMLYDNAQLVPLYVDAWKITGQAHYARIARETCAFVLRELTHPEGAFLAALDADSEGEEGLFYVWTPVQLADALGPADGARAARLLGVTPSGNFEHGRSALTLPRPLEDHPPDDRAFLEGIFPVLFEVRGPRVRPHRDDKVITAWTALMISALARAAAPLHEPAYVDAAARAARFLLDEVTVEGRLRRTWKDGRAPVLAFLDDHAFLCRGLLDLWEATHDRAWLERALALADTTVDLFWEEGEGLFYAGRDGEQLLARRRHALGGALPSGHAVAAEAFARLALLCGRDDLGTRADQILGALQPLIERAPRAIGYEAVAASWRSGGTAEIGIVGPADAAAPLLAEVHRRFLPFAVTARLDPGAPTDLLPWMEDRGTSEPATAYVCEGFTCQLPVTTPAELGAQLDALGPRAARPRPTTGVRVHAPALPSDPAAWLNTDHPLSLQALRGQVVVLDFWTYCCINCMHVLPELAAVEAAFAGQPVTVIGVHAAKFPAEREADNIARAVARHRIAHPVVNDAAHTLWSAYAIRSWPTIVVLDVDGRVAWQRPGEVDRQTLIGVVQGLLDEAEGRLAAPPAALAPPTVDGPLPHVGKVSVWPAAPEQHQGADPFGPDARCYLSVTGADRIVECALSKGDDGWPQLRRLRTFGDGTPGLVDGVEARFHEPQGTRRQGDQLWVADTGNHALRVIDLDTGAVRTVAGTGQLGRSGRGDPDEPRSVPLRSPWDVAAAPDVVTIAMAGNHQIWLYFPDQDRIVPYLGSGAEDHVDGEPAEAALAQPSGLSLWGRYLFFADSEVSSIRVYDFEGGKVGTLVGEGLFDFGDIDGAGDQVRLQHPLGVAAVAGRLYIADTFNGKIKELELPGRTVRTLASGLGEPGGLDVAGHFLLVADTNHHRVVAVHRFTGEVRPIPVD